MIVKIKINSIAEREKLVVALAFSGHKCWVEEFGNYPYQPDYFVFFEESDLEKTTSLGTYQKAETVK